MIGLFDSGIGGLSVLTEIRSAAPETDLLYVADSARAPYGSRDLETVRRISHEIADWLARRGANPIVVACHTASAGALDSLRASHPGLSFVGMEPAVKPAAAATRTGVIGVLATSATFEGRLFRSVVQRYAGSSRILTKACPSWVGLVERGMLSGEVVEQEVSLAIRPMLEAGADRLVLGCTHFSFLRPVISAVAGEVEIIDPAPAVAAQALRLSNGDQGSGRLILAASGDPDELARLATDVGGVKASESVLPFPS